MSVPGTGTTHRRERFFAHTLEASARNTTLHGPFAIDLPPYYLPGANPAVTALLARSVPDAGPVVEEPFTADVRAAKNDAVYRLHPYHTKVPSAGIEPFIAHYTRPGHVVLDPFCGSGMTGVAALAQGRRAVLVDLSPAAGFIASNYCLPLNPDEVLDAGRRVLGAVWEARRGLYGTRCRQCNSPAEIAFILWSDLYECTFCGGCSSFWRSAADDSGKGRRRFPCPHCGRTLNRLRTRKTGARPEVFACICPACTPSKAALCEWDKFEQARLESIEEQRRRTALWYPQDSIPNDFATRRTYWKHIRRVHEFFESRELLALATLYDAIGRIEKPEVRHRLLFLFTAIVPHASRMNRYKPAGIRSGVIYVPAIRKAVNPFADFQTRLEQYCRFVQRRRTRSHSGEARAGAAGTVSPEFAVSCQSAASLSGVPDESVDYVFTDPPFGGNLQYSELNLLWEAWLGQRTNAEQEAVINRCQRKGVAEYGELMSRAFAEIHRVLKPGRWMTLVFHNSSHEVWQVIQRGLHRAGFQIASVCTFDKRIGTYNQVVGEGACGYDVTVNCRKAVRAVAIAALPASENDMLEAVRNALKGAVANEDRSARKLYSRLVAWCMERSLEVPCGFEAFRAFLAREFVCRDGLWHDVAEASEETSEATPNALGADAFGRAE